MSFMGVEDGGHSELAPKTDNEKAGGSHPVKKHRAALQLRDLTNDKERKVVQGIVANPDSADEAGLVTMAEADYKFHSSELPSEAQAQRDQEVPPSVKEILSLPGLHREAVAEAEVERLTQEILRDYASVEGIKEEWLRASAGGVKRARALGQKLITVKILLQKTKEVGHFLKWCERLPFSVDQAERYMQLARLPDEEFEKLKPQSQRQALMRIGFLAIDEKKRLAAPKEADDLTAFRKLMGRLMTQAKRYAEEHVEEMLKISKPYNEWLAEQEAKLEVIEAERLMTQTRRWDQGHEQERLFKPANAGQADGLEANRGAVDLPSEAGQEPDPTDSAHVRNLDRQVSEGWAAFNPDGELLWSTISTDERDAKDKLLLVTRPAHGRAELSDLRARGYRVVTIKIVAEHTESRSAKSTTCCTNDSAE